MSDVYEVNPESVVLRQLDGYWQKIAALLVWKLASEGVVIKATEMAEFHDLSAAGDAILLTHGHKDSIEFKIVDAEAAKRIAEHDAGQSGSA